MCMRKVVVLLFFVCFGSAASNDDLMEFLSWHCQGMECVSRVISIGDSPDSMYFAGGVQVSFGKVYFGENENKKSIYFTLLNEQCEYDKGMLINSMIILDGQPIKIQGLCLDNKGLESDFGGSVISWRILTEEGRQFIFNRLMNSEYKLISFSIDNANYFFGASNFIKVIDYMEDIKIKMEKSL
ncbi:hypothetical protein [Vibrio cincinnatiensis]|uniref:hypothetical protein n=1 Tax=Vibrio cincinnatiensis TaxID=675 RepID=UPI001EDF7DB5|nr:hypothetical protein [Vibrio cincinnatiensis]MCG3727564.1 hypothetical protein [Vibrio cincinnatiensis]